MHNKSIFILSLGMVASLFSCKKDDGGEIAVIIPEPKTYVFERDGASTVSFSGQTTRIKMAEELIKALKDNTKNKLAIQSIFSHEEGGSNFSDATLNSSTKNVRNKVAASKDFFASNTADATSIKAVFDGWITDQVTEVFPKWTETAIAGTAGMIQEAGGGSTRYVSAKGLEYNQVFGKSLIGGLMVDQILNNYLSTAVLDEGTNEEDNKAASLVDGKKYTTMEHKWDEAYGYIYGTAKDKATPNSTIGKDDSFLNKYIGKVAGDDDFKEIAKEIYNAFKLGRAAIVALEYKTRIAQAEIIREKISTVIAARAVYYLQQGKAKLAVADRAAVFHNLSESYGLIYSLQFTRNPDSATPYFSSKEVKAMLDDLMKETNGLWNVKATTLDKISSDIAAKFSFTVAQAGS